LDWAITAEPQSSRIADVAALQHLAPSAPARQSVWPTDSPFCYRPPAADRSRTPASDRQFLPRVIQQLNSLRSTIGHTLRLSFMVVAVAVSLGCPNGDGSTGPTPPGPGPTNPPPANAPASISLTATLTTIQAGSFTQLAAQVRDQNGNLLSASGVTYTSANSALLTIDAANRANSVGPVGSTTVRASIASGSSTVQSDPLPIVVIPAAPAAIVAHSGGAQTGKPAEGPADQLVARVEDRFQNRVPSVTVSWTAVTTGGALAQATSVTDPNGLATNAFTLGTEVKRYTISAGVSGVSPAAQFNIDAAPPRPLVSLDIGPAKIVYADVGTNVALAVSGRRDDGTAVATPSVTYASRTESVATVSTTGSVSIVGKGQAIIIATAATNTAIVDSILVVGVATGGIVLRTDMTSLNTASDKDFTVRVIADLRNSGKWLGSAMSTITWNPAVMTYVSHASGGSGQPVPTVNTSKASTGELTLSVASAEGHTGTVTLLAITFRAAAAGAAGLLSLDATEATEAKTFVNLLSLITAVRHPITSR
jgi:hypothetical protein